MLIGLVKHDTRGYHDAMESAVITTLEWPLCDMKVKSHFVSIYKPTDQEINWIVNLGLKDEQDESPFNALGLILQTRRAVELKSDVIILHSFSAIFSFAP